MEYDWISAKEMYRTSKSREEAKIDPDISYIVGKPVRVNDPRLVHLVVRWKRMMGYDPDGVVSYNFLQHSGFVEDLRKTFNGQD